MVRFVESSLSSNQLNLSRAAIPCVLENDVGEAGRSARAQPVTLYITVNIIPPNLYNSPPSIPAAEEAAIPGRNQFSAPDRILPLSHHEPVETGNTMPQCREEIPHTGTTNPRLALHLSDKVMNRIAPNDRSKRWEKAVGRIKWVMDTLGPIAEVRVMPF